VRSLTFKGTLFPFQEEAVARMVERRRLLVGFQMGMGKTVLTIAAAERLFDQEKAAVVLVIAPASLKYQWLSMIEQFTVEANPVVIDGTPEERRALYEQVMAGEYDYVIMNYDQVVNDWRWVSKLPRDVVVLDEATAIKNFRPKRSKRVKKLNSKYKWALTGQPVENKAEEIFSIMQWVDPDVLGDWEYFDRTFVSRQSWGTVRFYKNLPTLHNALSDAMIRRTRKEVADQFPSIVEESLLVDFDKEGADLYRRIVRDLRVDLAEAFNSWGNFSVFSYYQGQDFGEQARGKIMSRLTCLRMLCDNPALLRISAQMWAEGQQGKQGITAGSQYAWELSQAKLLKPTKTPKLDATVDLLGEILTESPKNKVVLFSFFKHNLALIKAATAHLTDSVLFTGDINAKDREDARNKFSRDPACRLFLSSDAGGIGLDLPMANYLVSYNLPWSAGKWEQRLARTIRLSSQFPEVTLLSMLMAGSIEERQYEMLSQKQRIADAVIDGVGIDKKGRLSLDLASLSDFLAHSDV
jgi:SNF2 family DNA or RNA helicase